MSESSVDALTEPEKFLSKFYPGSKHKIGEAPHQQERDLMDADWAANPKVYKINGEDVEFFTIGQLAKALGRRPVTIRKWETDGVIPQATFRVPSKDPRGQRRLYSRAQVEGILKIAHEEGVLVPHSKAIKDTEFSKRVLLLFRELQESA